MTLKDLKEYYSIPDYKHNEKLLVHHKDTNQKSRMVHKYLCSVTKKGHSFIVDGFKPTTKLDVLKDNINTYVNKLPYDSEYYFPLFRKSIFVHYIIHDYLESIGFESGGSGGWDYNNYILKRKTVYNSPSNEIHISLTGLDEDRDGVLPKTVSINLWLGDYSWVSSTVKRNPEAIKKAIDSLLKPFFIGESVTNIESADKLKNVGETDIFLKMVTKNLDVVSVDYKAELKIKLLELVEKL